MSRKPLEFRSPWKSLQDQTITEATKVDPDFAKRITERYNEGSLDEHIYEELMVFLKYHPMRMHGIPMPELDPFDEDEEMLAIE